MGDILDVPIFHMFYPDLSVEKQTRNGTFWGRIGGAGLDSAHSNVSQLVNHATLVPLQEERVAIHEHTCTPGFFVRMSFPTRDHFKRKVHLPTIDFQGIC